MRQIGLLDLAAEMELFQNELALNGDSGLENLVWTLINSQQFRFVY